MNLLNLFLTAHVHESGDGGFAHSLYHALIHTVEHSWYILPTLFLVYLLIEVISHKAMDRLRGALSSPTLGVISASALGLIPQCGFSVAASNLYAEKLISAGAVVAVFIATSDEALPIIASSPDSIKWFLPLVLIKFFYAVLAGNIVNLVFRLARIERKEHHCEHHHHHGHHGHEHIHEAGEHHHCANCDSNAGIFKTAVLRSLSVFAFVLITAFAVNLAVELLGEDKLCAILLTNSPFQPFLAALIGLVPNCAVSVLSANLFAAGTLGFGSLVAALCSGAGIGVAVLFRVNRNMRANLTLLSLLYLLSAILGFVIEIII